MIQLSQYAVSTEPVQFQVVAWDDGASYNPSSDPVYVAFVPVTGSNPSPAGATWNTASWEVDAGNPQASYWASILVGPLNGGIVLTAGTYLCFVKVTDNPAVPVKAGAYLTIS